MAGNFVNASSQFISLDAHASGLKTPNGWCSFWFKSSTTGTGHAIYAIGKAPNDTARIYIGGLTATWPDESIVFENYTSGANLYCAVRNGHDYYLDGVRHHFLIKMDGANKIWIDGVEETWAYANGNASTADYFLSTPTADVARIASLALAATFRPTGIIEDFRIYDNSLTVTDNIAKIIYESRGNDNITTGLKFRCLMNEQTDGANMTSAIDISGNGYNGTPTNTPTCAAAPFKIG